MNEALVNNPDFNDWLMGRIPSKRWGRPDELVGAAVFLASARLRLCQRPDHLCRWRHARRDVSRHDHKPGEHPCTPSSFTHRRICGSTAIPIQRQAPGEVRVRIANGGICGSDLHYYHHGGFGIVRIQQPMALGHEIAGVVAAVGNDVPHLKAGMRVAVNPSKPCGLPPLPRRHAQPVPRHALPRQRDALSPCAGRFSRDFTVDAIAGRTDLRQAVDRRGRGRRAARGVPARRQAGRPPARQARADHRLRPDRRADDCGRALWRRVRDRRDRCRRRTARGRAKSSARPYHQCRDQ